MPLLNGRHAMSRSIRNWKALIVLLIRSCMFRSGTSPTSMSTAKLQFTNCDTIATRKFTPNSTSVLKKRPQRYDERT